MPELMYSFCRAGWWHMRKQQTFCKQRRSLNLTQWSGALMSQRRRAVPNLTTPSPRAAPTPTSFTRVVTSAFWGFLTLWAQWFLWLRAPSEIRPSALNWGTLTMRTYGTITWPEAPPCTAMSTAPSALSTRVSETRQRNTEEPTRIRPETTLLCPVKHFHISPKTSIEKLWKSIFWKTLSLHASEEKYIAASTHCLNWYV